MAAIIFLLAGWPASAIDLGGYSDDELIAGFNATVFGSETADSDEAGALAVKKFVGPVRFQIVDRSNRELAATVALFLDNLSQAVANLTFVAASEADADLFIYIVDRRDYTRTIRDTAWPGVNTTFLEGNSCSAVIAARRSGIERGLVYLVGDEGFMSFAHCMVEEILQSLGPANDSDALNDSIFNDRSTLNTLQVFDWFLINMLYDPSIRPGMTFEDVQPLLPAAIAAARQRLVGVMEDMGALRHHTAK